MITTALMSSSILYTLQAIICSSRTDEDKPVTFLNAQRNVRLSSKTSSITLKRILTTRIITMNNVSLHFGTIHLSGQTIRYGIKKGLHHVLTHRLHFDVYQSGVAVTDCPTGCELCPHQDWHSVSNSETAIRRRLEFMKFRMVLSAMFLSTHNYAVAHSWDKLVKLAQVAS